MTVLLQNQPQPVQIPKSLKYLRKFYKYWLLLSFSSIVVLITAPFLSLFVKEPSSFGFFGNVIPILYVVLFLFNPMLIPFYFINMLLLSSYTLSSLKKAKIFNWVTIVVSILITVYFGGSDLFNHLTEQGGCDPSYSRDFFDCGAGFFVAGIFGVYPLLIAIPTLVFINKYLGLSKNS